jgi:hypothetical protein
MRHALRSAAALVIFTLEPSTRPNAVSLHYLQTPLDSPDKMQIVATPWQQDQVQPRHRAVIWLALGMLQRHAAVQAY